MPPPAKRHFRRRRFRDEQHRRGHCRSDGRVEAVTFDHGGARLKVYVTAMCFWDERHGNGRRTHVEGGPWAIEQFLEGLSAHRFIQSFKTFAASASFQETRIFRERYRFEDLLTAFFRTLVRHGGSRDRFFGAQCGGRAAGAIRGAQSQRCARHAALPRGVLQARSRECELRVRARGRRVLLRTAARPRRNGAGCGFRRRHQRLLGDALSRDRPGF